MTATDHNLATCHKCFANSAVCMGDGDTNGPWHVKCVHCGHTGPTAPNMSAAERAWNKTESKAHARSQSSNEPFTRHVFEMKRFAASLSRQYPLSETRVMGLLIKLETNMMANAKCGHEIDDILILNRESYDSLSGPVDGI